MRKVTREIRKPPAHTVGTHPSLALLFVEALPKVIKAWVSKYEPGHRHGQSAWMSWNLG